MKQEETDLPDALTHVIDCIEAGTANLGDMKSGLAAIGYITGRISQASGEKTLAGLTVAYYLQTALTTELVDSLSANPGELPVWDSFRARYINRLEDMRTGFAQYQKEKANEQ